MTTEPGTLEAEALKRRERLRALKKRCAPDDSKEEKQEKEDSNVLPKPKFRSYNPQDDELKENTLPRLIPTTVEEQVKDDIDDAKKSESVVQEVDLLNLAPRKPDWDLKRDISKKLDKLDRRTQRAIIEIIRERIKTGEEDLTAGVSTASKDIDSD